MALDSDIHTQTTKNEQDTIFTFRNLHLVRNTMLWFGDVKPQDLNSTLGQHSGVHHDNPTQAAAHPTPLSAVPFKHQDANPSGLHYLIASFCSIRISAYTRVSTRLARTWESSYQSAGVPR